MAAFVAGDVTYLALNMRTLGDGRKFNRVRMTFGAGSETYATGGIPLSKGKLGCPSVIESLKVVDQGDSGYVFQYDQSAEKLLVFVSPSHNHDIKLIESLTADATIGVNATVKLGKNSATNATISGANSATNGGIVASTAAALTELANATDIATQVLEVEVVGW